MPGQPPPRAANQPPPPPAPAKQPLPGHRPGWPGLPHLEPWQRPRWHPPLPVAHPPQQHLWAEPRRPRPGLRQLALVQVRALGLALALVRVRALALGLALVPEPGLALALVQVPLPASRRASGLPGTPPRRSQQSSWELTSHPRCGLRQQRL